MDRNAEIGKRDLTAKIILDLAAERQQDSGGVGGSRDASLDYGIDGKEAEACKESHRLLFSLFLY